MKYLFLFGFLLCVSAPILAQDDSTPDIPVGPDERPDQELIVVTANGQPQPIDQTGQSVSVIGSDELNSIQGQDLTRVLTRLPGVSFSRNGGLGAQTGLNVRGANADQLLVLVDGVRIADYASPGGGYDLGNLLSGNLDKIELLRGSNSVVWGSQAIGGVLAVTTEEVNGARASAEYGAYGTVSANASAGIARANSAVSLSAGYARNDGFSAKAGSSEADGYRQWSLSGKGRLALGESLTLRATGRYADSHLGIDLVSAGSPDFQDTREASGRIGLDYFSDQVRLSGGLAYADVRRDYDTGFGLSSYTGRSWRAEVNGWAQLADQVTVDFGADSDWTRAASSFDPAAKARQSSGHALLGWTQGGVSLAGGVRIDDHDRFGTHTSFGANGTADLGAGWRLRGSFGEGFKAPTLYQLYGGFVGNLALKPETSRSYEAGIEKGDRNGSLHLGLTAFRRDSRNLIDLDAGFVYQNIARARAQGIELELGARITGHFRVQAAYTWLDARDLTNARDLARRPRHALALNADWQTPLPGLTLGADLRLQGDSVEYDFFGTPTALDGFALVTVRASLPLGDRFELFGRIENVGNVHYETAAGFNSPGRSAYGGIRVRF